MPQIGFLGGTGIEAKGLALRFASAGASVVLGSRSPERAAQAADACNTILGGRVIRGLGNREMIGVSELIFLTVPFADAVDALESHRSLFGEQHVIVDVTVPMVFRNGHAAYKAQDSVSHSEILASHLPPGVPIVAAFKTIPALILEDQEIPLKCDVVVCSDFEQAKLRVIEAARMIPSLRPLDGGSLNTAYTLERMAVLAAELNRRYRSRGARFKVEGI